MARLAPRIMGAYGGLLSRSGTKSLLAEDPGISTGLIAVTAKRSGSGQGAQDGRRPWARPKNWGNAVAHYERACNDLLPFAAGGVRVLAAERVRVVFA